MKKVQLSIVLVLGALMFLSTTWGCDLPSSFFTV